MVTRASKTVTALVALATSLVVALGGWALTAAPARAGSSPGVEVSRYQPILQKQYPATTADMRGVGYILDPDQCTALPFCNTIPMKVDPPVDIGKADDWFLVVTITWPSAAQDLDLYFWDNKQFKDKNPPPPGDAGATSPYTRLQQATNSSGSAKPIETFTLRTPVDHDYNLTIESKQGSAAYKLTALITVAPYSAPFESIEQDITIDLNGPPVEQPVADVPVEEPVVAAPVAPTLSPLADPADDPELSNVGVAKPNPFNVGGVALPTKNASNQRSPGGGVLAFWLLVVPAIVVGVPTGLLAERRRRLAWG